MSNDVCSYPACNCPFEQPAETKCFRGLELMHPSNGEAAMPVKEINFTSDNYAKIAQGKRTTIRLGDKDYQLGGVDFTVDDGLTSEYQPVIVEVRTLRFNRLSLQDAINDGFNSLEELRQELQACYQKFISDREELAVIRFEV